MNDFTGFRIIETTLLTEQFRFPRSKKKRIREKWAHRDENRRPSRTALYDEVHGTIYIHPQFADQLRQSL